MYLLILLAVNINNPSDIPGKLELTLPTREICQQALDSLRYDLKFRVFRIDAQCVKVENSKSGKS